MSIFISSIYMIISITSIVDSIRRGVGIESLPLLSTFSITKVGDLIHINPDTVELYFSVCSLSGLSPPFRCSRMEPIREIHISGPYYIIIRYLLVNMIHL